LSTVLSIRIPRKLKEEMNKLKDVVDWKKEIISFIEQRIRYYKKYLVLKEIEKELEKHPLLPKGSRVRSVREDRDRN
jgi:hypothetical protein